MRIELREVGPRDGLQNEEQTLEPAVRAELVNRLARAGFPRVEAASFVNPARVPQMAGAEDVAAGIERRDGTSYVGLALNEQGYDRLRATGLDEVHFALGATESFQQRNAGSSVDDGVAAAARIASRAREDGIRCSVTISVAFGCPFEGPVDPARVLELAERLDGDELVLADTIGVATPVQVRGLTEQAAALGKPLGGHFHNTRSTGFANAYAALEGGAALLDASVGGIGGCPFAPRATGNVASEDLVYMLQGDGVETGVDLDTLIEVSEWVSGLLGRELPGQLARAGRSPTGR